MKQCDKEGCSNKARWYVSDGPHGLSPRMNEYYLCNDHRPVAFAFENEFDLEHKPV